MKRKLTRITWLTASICLLVVGVATISPGSVHAESRVDLSNSELDFVFQATKLETRTFTLTVTGDPIQSIRITSTDLIGTDNTPGQTITSDKIVVTPASVDEVSDQQRFEVRVGGDEVDSPGTYDGELQISYLDQSEEDQPSEKVVTIPLLVTVTAQPNVTADSVSQDVTISVQSSLFDLPLWGQAMGGNGAKTLGEALIRVEQKGVGEANLKGIHPGLLQTNKDIGLPRDVVLAANDLVGASITRAGLIIPLTIRGDHLRAGTYTGTIAIEIDDQPEIVEPAITLNIKYGWPYAVLTLLLGMVIALFLNWWGSEGKARLNIAEKIVRTREDLTKRPRLQIEEHEEAKALLDEAIDAFNRRMPNQSVEERLASATTFITAEKARATSLSSDFEDLEERIGDDTKPAAVYRRLMREKIQATQRKLHEGKYDQFDHADDAYNDLRVEVEDFDTAVVGKLEELKETNYSDYESVSKLLESGQTLEELKQIMLNRTPPTGTRQAGGRRPTQQHHAQLDENDVTFNIKRGALTGDKIFVGFIIYAVTFIVGFISLYVNSDTFGADLMDFVGLFLWGATFETVRGKTTSFQTLVEEISKIENE